MLPVYEAIFKEDIEGIYALSVVENPAMEDHWITLSEHKMELSQIDEEKRLLLGAALIPDKKIYRNIDGKEFYITFSEENIEKLAHNFFKNQNNNNSSLEHEIQLEGMSVVEGWIVQDSVKDKSYNYGKSYPKGTFVAMMKVDNDDIWEKAKKGEIKGFSIDALLGLEKIKLNTNIMNEEIKKSIISEVIDGVKALFNKEEEVVETKEVVEEVVEDITSTFDKESFMKEVIEVIKSEFASQVKEKDENFNAKLSDLEAENERLKAKLNKQPEVEEVVVTPTETKLRKVQYGQNRPKSIQDRVFASFNE